MIARLLTTTAFLLAFAPGAPAQVTCPSVPTLSGASTDDVLVGTEDGDRIAGNGGRDVLRGLGGSDCLRSGSFNDRLFGGPDNDQLIAEGGDDFVDGGEGDDELNGGSNRDILIGGPGRDEVIGEGDDDVFVVHAGDVPAGQTELLHGGSGLDVAVFDFDPGDAEPGNFTVTDPATGGRYRFVEVERIELSICGNGVVERLEECDDGNRTSGDGCDANCTPTGCGNGLVTDGETCDDGNTTGGDGCSADCVRECGNGTREGQEECDDGNQLPGDGCEPDCRTNACGNGVLGAGEACDDGNRRNGDGCSSTCARECGNGTVGPDEQCDDGNTTDGDGCTAACLRECTEDTACADGEPCTTDECAAGSCVNRPLTGDAAALCALDGTLIEGPCAGDRLARGLRVAITRLRRVLERVTEGGNRDKLLRRAARLANLAQTRAARLASRDQLTPECAADLEGWLDELELLIEELRTP